MGLSWTEIVVVFAVLLLFFGAKRIPDVARALGRASREFKNARDGVVSELDKTLEESPKARAEQQEKTSEEKK